MKNVFRLAVVLMLCLTSFTSQAGEPIKMGLFNHLGVGAHVGTAGYGFEVATPLTKFINLRAGMSFMPGISFGDTYDVELNAGNNVGGYYEMDVDASIKRTQTHVIANIYPFAWTGGAFYIAAGAYFGGKDIVKLKGHSDELAGMGDAMLEFEDYNIPVKNGNVTASLRSKSFRPYLGLGFGRPVPTRRLNFAFELGVQFMGKMKVMAGGEELKPMNDDADGTWHDIMDKVTVYPVMKFTLSGRIF